MVPQKSTLFFPQDRYEWMMVRNSKQGRPTKLVRVQHALTGTSAIRQEQNGGGLSLLKLVRYHTQEKILKRPTRWELGTPKVSPVDGAVIFSTRCFFVAFSLLNFWDWCFPWNVNGISRATPWQVCPRCGTPAWQRLHPGWTAEDRKKTTTVSEANINKLDNFFLISQAFSPAAVTPGSRSNFRWRKLCSNTFRERTIVFLARSLQ